MNLVIDDAVEVKQITKTNLEEKRTPLGIPFSHTVAGGKRANLHAGQILLKGDNVSLIQSLSN